MSTTRRRRRRRQQSFAMQWLLWPIRAALYRELRKAMRKGGLYG